MANELFYTPFINDTSLKGYWRLESDFHDSSASGYDLTGNNTPTDVTGYFGNGKQFASASSESATIASASCADLEIAGSQTWMCWYKKTSGTDHAILGKSDSTPTKLKRIYSNNLNNVSFTLTGLTTNTSVTSSNAIANGAWSFICGIYDSTNSLLKIWIDGTKTEVTASGSATATGGQFALARDGDYSNYANGIIDEVAIFNRALSDDEVTRYYNGTLVSMGFIL